MTELFSLPRLDSLYFNPALILHFANGHKWEKMFEKWCLFSYCSSDHHLVFPWTFTQIILTARKWLRDVWISKFFDREKSRFLTWREPQNYTKDPSKDRSFGDTDSRSSWPTVKCPRAAKMTFGDQRGQAKGLLHNLHF